MPTGARTGDPNWGLLYDYLPGTDLVQNITLHRRTTGTHSAPYRTWRTARTFETYRDVLRAVAHYHNPDAENGQSTLLARYDYARVASPTHGADDLGHRTNLKYEGAAFAATLTQTFGHNDRSELTSTTRSQTGLPSAWTYAYDPIGNRTQSTFDPPPAGSPEATDYTANAVNAYTVTVAGAARGGLRYDADGNLAETYSTGDSNCDGAVDFFDIDYFVAALGGEAAWAALFPNGSPSCPYSTNDVNGDGVVNFFDIDYLVGVLGSSGVWVQYSWDAENRLTGVTPMKPSASSKKLAYKYDHRNRRVERAAYDWVGPDPDDWSAAASVQRYVWAGWLTLMEVQEVGGAGFQPARKHTWGLDLAGQGGAGILPASLESAGGIGGLLAVEDRNGTADPGNDLRYVFLYDANGNVTQIVDPAGTEPNVNIPSSALKAHYEYTPYGDLRTAATGTYAATNAWRFSTKPFDPASGLGYWGERYYSATLGKWMNRDPVGEVFDYNLYSMLQNNPIDLADAIGLCLLDGPPDKATPPDQPTTQPEDPCAKVNWDAGSGRTGASATVCDGKGNIVICLNPKASKGQPFPGQPGAGAPSGGQQPTSNPSSPCDRYTHRVDKCLCEGELAGKGKITQLCNSTGANPCKKADGSNVPAGTIDTSRCGDCAREKTEIAVQEAARACLEKYDAKYRNYEAGIGEKPFEFDEAAEIRRAIRDAERNLKRHKEDLAKNCPGK